MFEELLRWLDVIPGRNWLLLGPGAAEVAALVRAGYKPAGVQLAEDTAGFPDSTFDVAITTSPAGAAELRRVLVPAGCAAAVAPAEPAELERQFRTAGLHAVASRLIGNLGAIRGTR